jgi:Ca-activated chloride channel family protein
MPLLKIKSPQGVININQPGHTEYKNGVVAMIRKSDSHEILTTFNLPNHEKLLVGNYDIECTTLPRTVFKNIKINQNQTTELKIDQPGVVNFVATSKGIGSIYAIDDNGRQKWIYNLDKNQLRNTVTIQPGNYKVVFRSENARGSKFTSIKAFEIKAGSSFNIQL